MRIRDWSSDGFSSDRSCDLKQRQLTVTHSVYDDRLLEKLVPLALGATILSTEVIVARQHEMPGPDDAGEAKTLRLLLAINGAMFIVEILLGVIAKSAGLVADSLEMFADEAV